MIKKIIALTMLVAIASPAFSAEKNIDYCATKNAWATQRAIMVLKEGKRQLDYSKLTVDVIALSRLKSKGASIKSKEFGVFYSQTLRLIIPDLNSKGGNKTFFVTSLISDSECSIGQPQIVDVTDLGLLK
ncbi:hypothetical protein [Serratia sp. CY85251]|uniref:hypothetical protein n=1 Tax=Serratia sp. CY85251 TaxID=3383696 RepID=UPI003FA053E5